MLDIQFIRDNADKIKDAAKKKGLDPKVVDRLLKVDKARKQLITEVENLRQRRNQLKKDEVLEGKKIKKLLCRLEPDLRAVEKEFKDLMLWLPIPPAKDTPVGKNESGNKEVKRWGKPPKFTFKPKDYLDLAGGLDLLDLERGAKIGGFRQYLIKNEAVILEQALLRWSLDQLAKKGFTLFRPTSMVKEAAKIGTGHFPFAREDTYQVDQDLFLSGTTEVPLVNYHANEILKEADLPIKYAGLSVAFRKEVGSYGRDTKGIFRVHEFWQTEMVVLCRNSQKETLAWWEKLLQISEELMQDLEIPYRVVLCCTGDLSSGQVGRYDIEAWVPSQKRFRETHSDACLLDFQTRRLNIRYKNKKGETIFPYSLNNTGLAVPRILVPLLENHQQKDGSVIIPKPLRGYTGFGKILPKT